ncbi:putative chlorophyll a-b binding protein 3C, chloroplastic-like isoform 1 [Capsicum annuum]|uniref:probable purine permease 6 n=1 Tax=Capsicum annuum TaxID=4072 RepID=UPI001FB12173|nr:probable purine permease 6 [Capsicum annuum]KAF3674614.1 putative chlorophyll a-b binding protein 3C, chloroplastic-like isoform 1 [Capsicum annuum]
MEEAQQKLLDIPNEEIFEKENHNIESSGSTHCTTKHKWWYQVAIFTLLTLIGEVITSLLVSIYFTKGGKSIWLISFVQNLGFPTLLPFLFYASLNNSNNNNNNSNSQIEVIKDNQEPHICIIFLVYVVLGVLLGGVSVFDSIGLKYLQVSTYSLINTSQLGFTVVFSFSFFLDGRKLITPSIVNSVVLVTVASVILVLHNNESGEKSGGKFLLGFFSAVGGSTTYSLVLSLTEFSYRKILKGRKFIDIIEMSIYQTLVASIVILLGLFISGDWKNLIMEMEKYQLGKVYYAVILLFIAISCQLNVVASIWLVFKVNPLLSNVLNNLGALITPIFGVIFLNDKIKGLKLVVMFLAIWGFASQIYQQYLNYMEENEEIEQNSRDICEVSHN